MVHEQTTCAWIMPFLAVEKSYDAKLQEWQIVWIVTATAMALYLVIVCVVRPFEESLTMKIEFVKVRVCRNSA